MTTWGAPNTALGKCVYLGAIHGASVWSAYALVEFLSSSVLFRLIRPYATFTAWHWQLTGLLVFSYLIAGLVLGGLAGLVAGIIREKTQVFEDGDLAGILEGAAVLTLLGAFAANLLAISRWPQGKLLFLIACAAMAALVVAGMRSARFSVRLRLAYEPVGRCWTAAGNRPGIRLHPVAGSRPAVGREEYALDKRSHRYDRGRAGRIDPPWPPAPALAPPRPVSADPS